MASEKIFLAHGIHCSPNFSLISLAYCEEYEYVCVCVYEDVEIVCYHCYKMMLRVNNFLTQTRSGEKLLSVSEQAS
jgi:hypothetical protein